MVDSLLFIHKITYYDKNHIQDIRLIHGTLNTLFIRGINYFTE